MRQSSLPILLGLFGMLVTQMSAAAETEFSFWPGAQYDPVVPTLQQVLGYASGDRITGHAKVVRYFESLQRALPDQVRIIDYATSWEGRRLFYVVVGSARNMAQLDQLQTAMQSLAEPGSISKDAADRLIADTPATVWLSYAVHGNEISSTDAAMLTAYHLLAVRNDSIVDGILGNTVVFIDPLQNPDGRDRFVHQFEMAEGLEADASRLSAEHVEPWPSGRANHYLFDLNRDWIALTQPETRGRVSALLEWYPLVFVDAHEMGSDSSYFFAPDATPFNPHLAADQRANLSLFGRNNARWFDRIGVDYFTGEIFDAFYPGYGASWPAYYGGMGMTYEQASARGLLMRRSDGSEFHYRETVRNHFVTSISTAQTTSNNREKFLRDFYQYRVSATQEGRNGDIREYLISANPDHSAADKLAALLVRQGARVRRAQTSFAACGNDYPPGSYAISLAQPSKRLLRTLLDPKVAMEAEFIAEQERRRGKDLPHEIYDVTAWSLPLMFNLNMDSCSRAVSGDFVDAGPELIRPGSLTSNGDSIAWLVPWGSRASGRFLAVALRAGLAVKSNDQSFKKGNQIYPSGSLILKASENPVDVEKTLERLARQSGAKVFAVGDSWVDKGPNFGSEQVVRIRAPRIALAWDTPTSPYSAGAARFVLERQFGYPVTVIRTRTLARADLKRFQVLILPGEGFGAGYAQVLGKDGAERLKRWVHAGGTLVLLGDAVSFAADPKFDLLATRREDAVKPDSDEALAEQAADPEAVTVAGRHLENMTEWKAAIAPQSEPPDSVAGVLVRADVDPDHWLAAGLPDSLNVMLRGGDIFTPMKLDDGFNVASFTNADELLVSGYLWEENRKQLAFKPFAMVQASQHGFVVALTQDPNFRAYMDGLNMIFLNAVFRAPAHASPVR